MANLVAHYVQEQNVELEEEKVIKLIATTETRLASSNDLTRTKMMT